MTKKFKKLNLCAAVATIGRRMFRKLSTLFPLTAPSIDIDAEDETTLNIYDEERLATSYDIFVNGVVVDTVSTLPIISFTIDTTTYQAEEGMTWGEWYTSEYNTTSFYINDLESGVPTGSYIMMNDGDAFVKSTETIVSGYEYETYSRTHSGGSN